ncbi:hypothetical protein QC763_0024040 [Podospora pseudopauciseta]|uniref:Uncharacterized protein n=1 Tax=Podospora pseudopauciseta TaxID=2093780 RepID=A0ABR0I200_9PEZI|nr:hypothetical protein QC763_0024040 [Podospora pseudopauciseta]
MPAAVRLPDINLDALNGVPSRVSDGTNGKHRLTRRVGGHRGAVLEEGRIVGVEGAEDGALGRAGGFGVVDVVEEEGEAEGVGEEDEFLCRKQMRPTFRTSLQIFPQAIKNSSPAIHSSVLSRVSLAKSCRCVTSLDSKYVNRWSSDWLLILMVFGVMLSIVKSKSGGPTGPEFSLRGSAILRMFSCLRCAGGGVCVLACRDATEGRTEKSQTNPAITKLVSRSLGKESRLPITQWYNPPKQ